LPNSRIPFGGKKGKVGGLVGKIKRGGLVYGKDFDGGGKKSSVSKSGFLLGNYERSGGEV